MSDLKVTIEKTTPEIVRYSVVVEYKGKTVRVNLDMLQSGKINIKTHGSMYGNDFAFKQSDPEKALVVGMAIMAAAKQAMKEQNGRS